MRSKELLSINILRGLAAFGVYYYHQGIGAILAERTGFKWLGYTDGFGSTYAVPLFFLISGYCIHLSNLRYVKTNEELPLLQYYKKRLWRIYPPYLIALLCSIGINYIVKPGYTSDLKDIVVHLVSFQGFFARYFNTINLVLWTISIELAFYLIYPVFYKIRLKYGLYAALAGTFIVSCLSITYFSVKTEIAAPERFFVLNLWFAWCFGAFLCELQAFNKASDKWLFNVSYAVIVIAFISTWFVDWENIFLIKDQLNVVVWALPLLFLVRSEGFLQKLAPYGLNIFGAIGLSGYSLYLLHEPLILLKNYLIPEYLPAYKNLAMELAIFIIPGLCYVNYLLFERPFIRFGKQKVNTAIAKNG